MCFFSSCRLSMQNNIPENIFIFLCRNYVVQFILELKNPYATSNLTCQFEGNYVNLSRQKFSSHVVEKCLVVCNNEARLKIIHELLSATYFEQLLQDPHANYVVQTALRVSEVCSFGVGQFNLYSNRLYVFVKRKSLHHM